MTIITSEAAAGAGKIGYKNLFTTTGVTVTASTEASGFAKENSYDWFGYDWWKPTAIGDSWIKASFGGAQAADYCAIWGHDLADHGSTIKVQYSTNDSTWVDAGALMPSDNSTIFIGFDVQVKAYWRLLVNNPATIASIGGVQIGEALTFPRNMEVGFSPPSLAPIIESKTAQSELGAFIGGRILNKGVKGDFNLTNLDPAWVRTYWVPFINHAQTPKPFVFAWDSVNHSSEVILGWASQQIKSPTYSTPLLMDISLSFEGNL